MSRGRRGGWQSLAGSSGQLWLELAFSTFPCFLLIQFPGSLWFILFLGTGLSGHFPRIGTLDYWGDTGVRKGKNQLRKGRFTTMPNLYISCRSVLHSYKFSPDLVGFTLKSDNFLSKIHIYVITRERKISAGLIETLEHYHHSTLASIGGVLMLGSPPLFVIKGLKWTIVTVTTF